MKISRFVILQPTWSGLNYQIRFCSKNRRARLGIAITLVTEDTRNLITFTRDRPVQSITQSNKPVRRTPNRIRVSANCKSFYFDSAVWGNLR